MLPSLKPRVPDALRAGFVYAAVTTSLNRAPAVGMTARQAAVRLAQHTGQRIFPLRGNFPLRGDFSATGELSRTGEYFPARDFPCGGTFPCATPREPTPERDTPRPPATTGDRHGMDAWMLVYGYA